MSKITSTLRSAGRNSRRSRSVLRRRRRSVGRFIWTSFEPVNGRDLAFLLPPRKKRSCLTQGFASRRIWHAAQGGAGAGERRLRQAASDLTLEKPVLNRAASAHYRAPPLAGPVLICEDRVRRVRAIRLPCYWPAAVHPAPPSTRTRRRQRTRRQWAPTSSRPPIGMAFMATAESRRRSRLPDRPPLSGSSVGASQG
jgi:hypothetical protein